MKKIAFYTPSIDIRGSCNALFYYAHYNETILGNESIIVTPLKGNKEFLALRMFTRRFKVLYYRDNVDEVLDGCDILYCIKHGLLNVDSTVSSKIKTVVHCVFDMTEKHGDVFVGVSETLARKFGYSEFVPHMIGLQPSTTKEDLREKLGIPKDAVVFGRYGGMDTFDLQFARNAISRVVRANNNVWFLFINTPIFDNHDRIIHMNPIIEDDDKNKFICTCDAHLECGSLGHTFGIAMGEFSVNNKSIIAYDGFVWNRAHIDIVKDGGIYYSDESSLYKILDKFDPKFYEEKDNNHYKNYNSDDVMKTFKNVFIDEVIR
jgi:hypothetical protein